MSDEPRRHPWLMVLLAVTAVGAIPVAFVGAEPTYLLGLPVWLWWSLGFTIATSGLTVLAVLKYWHDDEYD